MYISIQNFTNGQKKLQNQQENNKNEKEIIIILKIIIIIIIIIMYKMPKLKTKNCASTSTFT
jgi:hypothetical protein